MKLQTITLALLLAVATALRAQRPDFLVAPTYPANQGVYDIAAGDLNQDGKPDLVVTGGVSGAVQIFLGNGDGSISAGAVLRGAMYAASVALADVNGDGKVDILVADLGPYPYTIVPAKILLYAGNGDGTFQNSQQIATFSGDAQRFLLADVN